MAESKFEFVRNLQIGSIFYVEKSLDEDPSLLFTKLNQEGDLCIHYAAKSGNLELTTALLAHSNLLVSKSNQFNETALHYAAREGHLKTVQLLLTEKVNFRKTCINPGNPNHGKTALDYAEASKKFECAKEIQLSWIYVAAKSGNTQGFNDSFGFLLDTVLSEHPSYAGLVDKFPCIENFIQQARNFAPAKRPSLDFFHQELEESLSNRSLRLG